MFCKTREFEFPLDFFLRMKREFGIPSSGCFNYAKESSDNANACGESKLSRIGSMTFVLIDNLLSFPLDAELAVKTQIIFESVDPHANQLVG